MKLCFASNKDIDLRHEILSAFLSRFDSEIELVEEDVFFEKQASGSAENHVYVVTGGDGSLNYAVQDKRLFNDTFAICYFPNGTGNDFSRFFGLDKMSVEEIVELVYENKKTRIQIPFINSMNFINMVSIGDFANITPSVDRQTKDLFGSFSYFLEGVKSLEKIEGFTCKIQCPEENLEYDNVLGIFIGNSQFAGGGVKLLPDADPSEARLDALIVKDMDLSELAQLGLELRKDHPQLSSFNVNYITSSSIKIESPKDMNFSIDGEKKQLKSCEIGYGSRAIELYS